MTHDLGPQSFNCKYIYIYIYTRVILDPVIAEPECICIGVFLCVCFLCACAFNTYSTTHGFGHA